MQAIEEKVTEYLKKEIKQKIPKASDSVLQKITQIGSKRLLWAAEYKTNGTLHIFKRTKKGEDIIPFTLTLDKLQTLLKDVWDNVNREIQAMPQNTKQRQFLLPLVASYDTLSPYGDAKEYYELHRKVQHAIIQAAADKPLTITRNGYPIKEIMFKEVPGNYPLNVSLSVDVSVSKNGDLTIKPPYITTDKDITVEFTVNEEHSLLELSKKEEEELNIVVNNIVPNFDTQYDTREISKAVFYDIIQRWKKASLVHRVEKREGERVSELLKFMEAHEGKTFPQRESAWHFGRVAALLDDAKIKDEWKTYALSLFIFSHTNIHTQIRLIHTTHQNFCLSIH